MTSATLAILASALLGQAAKPDETLDLMKARAASYRFEREGVGPLRLKGEPAFRLGRQPADDILDGAIFFWLGEDDRPESAAQLFLIKHAAEPQGLWVHEFISLSPGKIAGRLDGKPSWSPLGPGIVYHALADAPKPAATAGQRLREMRSLAQEFRVADKFKEKTWDDLRLLTTPVARYGGKAGSRVIDGALFAFVTGTDPEAFLFVEAREGESGPGWHYALAPMTCFDLKATHAGKGVWSLPYRRESHDPSLPYFIRTEKP